MIIYPHNIELTNLPIPTQMTGCGFQSTLKYIIRFLTLRFVFAILLVLMFSFVLTVPLCFVLFLMFCHTLAVLPYYFTITISQCFLCSGYAAVRLAFTFAILLRFYVASNIHVLLFLAFEFICPFFTVNNEKLSLPKRFSKINSNI